MPHSQHATKNTLQTLFINDLKTDHKTILFGTCHITENNESEMSYLVATEKAIYRYSSIYPEQCLNILSLRQPLSCPPTFYENNKLVIVTSNGTSNAIVQCINTIDNEYSLFCSIPTDPFAFCYLPAHKEWIIVPKQNALHDCHVLKDSHVIASISGEKCDSTTLHHHILYKKQKYYLLVISWNTNKTLHYHKLMYDPHAHSLSISLDINISSIIPSKPTDISISKDGLSIYFLVESRIYWINLLQTLNIRSYGSYQIPMTLTPLRIIAMNSNQVCLFSHDGSNHVHVSLIESQFGHCINDMILSMNNFSKTELTLYWHNERLWFTNQNKLYVCMDSPIFNQQYDFASLIRQNGLSDKQIIKENFLISEQNISSIIKHFKSSDNQWIDSKRKEIQPSIQHLIKESSEKELDEFIQSNEFISEHDIALLLHYYFKSLDNNIEYQKRIIILLSFDIHPERMCKYLYETSFCENISYLEKLGSILLDLFKYKTPILGDKTIKYEQVIQWSYVFIDSFITSNRISRNDKYDHIYSLFKAMLDEINNVQLIETECIKEIYSYLDSAPISMNSDIPSGYSRQLLTFHPFSR